MRFQNHDENPKNKCPHVRRCRPHMLPFEQKVTVEFWKLELNDRKVIRHPSFISKWFFYKEMLKKTDRIVMILT